MLTDKIDKLRTKLRLIGIEITEKRNDWAIEITDGELFGYIDISDENKLVIPKYQKVAILKHFVLCYNDIGFEITVKGITTNIAKGSRNKIEVNWTHGTIAAIERKVVLLQCMDDVDGDITIAINHKGKHLQIEGARKKVVTSNMRINPRNGKEIYEIEISEFGQVQYRITIDEELEIVDYWNTWR